MKEFRLLLSFLGDLDHGLNERIEVLFALCFGGLDH